MHPPIPTRLIDKTRPFRKTATGFQHVKLVLKNGRVIHAVFLGEGGKIVKAGGRPILKEADLRFNPADVADVLEY